MSTGNEYRQEVQVMEIFMDEISLKQVGYLVHTYLCIYKGSMHDQLCSGTSESIKLFYIIFNEG